jgi:hypothetical protein
VWRSAWKPYSRGSPARFQRRLPHRLVERPAPPQTAARGEEHRLLRTQAVQLDVPGHGGDHELGERQHPPAGRRLELGGDLRRPAGHHPALLLDRQLAGQQPQMRQGQPEDLALLHAGAGAEREHGVVARRGLLEQRADLLGAQGLQPARRQAGQLDLVAGLAASSRSSTAERRIIASTR